MIPGRAGYASSHGTRRKSYDLGRASNNLMLLDPSAAFVVSVAAQLVSSRPNHIDATTDAFTSQYFPDPSPIPQRAALKKRRSSPPSHPQQRVSFNTSVDVRTPTRQDPATDHKRWYTKDEIRSMKNKAMDKRSLLRHSDLVDPFADHLPQDTLSSSLPPSADDTRYQELVSEMDKEVYLTQEDRRKSSSRRLYHYCRVLDEFDRQVENGYASINDQELAHSSRMASEHALSQALERGRNDATVAQAILLEEMRRK